MSMELKQYLKLSQQLVMTPQLQQAIKMLQLTQIELKQEIEQELNENPCLEEEAGVLPEDQGELFRLLKDLRENQYDPRSHAFSEQEDEAYNYEHYLSKNETLTDHLHWQLNHVQFSKFERRIAEFIFGNLDESGYLKHSVDAIAAELGTHVFKVERVLSVIQQFDPVGVASRDLRECLMNQLWSLEVKDEVVVLAEKIVDFLFDLFLHRETVKIGKKLRVSQEKVIEAYRIIAQLIPKPGLGFRSGNTYTEVIKPDAFVKQVGGKFVVTLNDIGLPRLRVSKGYLQLLSKKGNKKDLGYVKEKVKRAIWFIRSIEQRNSTLKRVVESLLRFQQTFFLSGPTHLKPLILKDVADDIQAHESTISRVTRGKYVQTPYGLFELKYFFNSSIATQDDEIASESVKVMIRDLIRHEDSKKPLSDRKICQMLSQQNIKIARRTVAKYREVMGISPSSIRRKKF